MSWKAHNLGVSSQSPSDKLLLSVSRVLPYPSLVTAILFKPTAFAMRLVFIVPWLIRVEEGRDVEASCCSQKSCSYNFCSLSVCEPL
jgi:hypothetical protein